MLSPLIFFSPHTPLRLIYMPYYAALCCCFDADADIACCHYCSFYVICCRAPLLISADAAPYYLLLDARERRRVDIFVFFSYATLPFLFRRHYAFHYT